MVTYVDVSGFAGLSFGDGERDGDAGDDAVDNGVDGGGGSLQAKGYNEG